MIELYKNIYLPKRFFYGLGVVILFFLLSYIASALYMVAVLLIGLLVLATIWDGYQLFNLQKTLVTHRKLPSSLSLGDEIFIELSVANISKINLSIQLTEELPFQFQIRDHHYLFSLKSGSKRQFKYPLKPLTRGKYEFGNIVTFISSELGLLERKIVFDSNTEIAVLPSVLQMKNIELKAFSQISFDSGIKRLRRIGHSYEFEQIKPYVPGDDPRSINWKATGKQGNLMVNQFQDERAQNVYAVIDKSRSMKMPFNGLSLLDYAINTSLAISNIVLKKQDKAGLITFSDKVGTVLKAERHPRQLKKIIELLHNEKERNLESNYQILYQTLRKVVPNRSLVLLYTNFESIYAMERVLPVLKKINQTHLLVVMFFENTVLKQFANDNVQSLSGIYENAIAQKLINEKELIVSELQKNGIQVVQSAPENLSLNTVNKYLELKSRGMI